MCAQQLEALVKMVPTKEEEVKLLCFEGNIGELDPAEWFVRDILSIPLCFPRIEVMLYRETFEDEVAHLRDSFQTLEVHEQRPRILREILCGFVGALRTLISVSTPILFSSSQEACKELRSSRLFLRLLEAVLKTGNRMNVGTTRGGARAFKLDALLKLADVKGTDGKTTLLHFVVQEIVRSEGAAASMAAEKTKPEEDDYRAMGLELVSGLSTELRHVKTTAGVDLDALAGSVSNLSAGQQNLQHVLEHHVLKTEFTPEDFVQSMRSFSYYAAGTVRELEEDEARVFRLVREIIE